LAYPGVQSVGVTLPINRFGATLCIKKERSLINQLLLPLPDLSRMHIMLLGNLIDRLEISYCLQSHFGLLLPAKTVSFEFPHRLLS
jgi:hypothetical protein